jgi:hypothetical protein
VQPIQPPPAGNGQQFAHFTTLQQYQLQRKMQTYLCDLHIHLAHPLPSGMYIIRSPKLVHLISQISRDTNGGATMAT